jgi:hypothetical protein
MLSSNDHITVEADVYNASLPPKELGNVFEQQLQDKLLSEDIRLVDSITLRSCLWGAGWYNMRDAVQLTDTSPCLRNVMPAVKARTLDLLSMYDTESEYSISRNSTRLMTRYVSLISFGNCRFCCAVSFALLSYTILMHLVQWHNLACLITKVLSHQCAIFCL